MIVLETPRLQVHQLQPDDEDALYAICRDPLTMQWMGDGQPLSFEQCQNWIAVSRRNYATHGYGACAVQLREAGLMVGFCGLVYAPGGSIPEIVYALRPEWWGRGLASEVVAAMLEYGMDRCGLERIMATIDPHNLASCRVVEKAGMRFERSETDADGFPMQVYFIERPKQSGAASR